MKKQTVMWTALPNGFATLPPGDGPTAAAPRLKLSVFVSPRLMTNEGMPKPKLSQFPDFVNWPGTGMTFSVRFNGGAPVPAAVASPAPSPTLWQALFKPTTYVRPYEFPPLDTRRVLSFPVGNVMGFLKQQYTQTAVEVGRSKDNGFPSVRDLNEGIGQIATYTDNNQGPTDGDFDPEKFLKDQLDRQLEKAQAVPPGPPNPLMDFYQVKHFYKPRSAARLAVPKPELDFHQVVSSLSDYPELLRRMGLVFDLEVPFDPAMPPSGYVQVEASWSPALGATTNINPKTHYILIGLNQWLPAPKPGGTSEIADGMLKLNAPPYGVEQVDVDGAALKAIDFANNYRRAQSFRHRSADTPQAYSVPAMRSGGLSLAKTGRALSLVQMLKLTKQKNAAAETGSSDIDLYAEDVTKGYRVDIWDSRSEVWRSLHRRQGVYKFTDGGILVSAEDEGATTMGVSQSADGFTPDLFLHEIMVNWQGWSLSAPRYGKMINNEDAAATPDNTPPPEFGLETTFNPTPRSLPKLRFGTHYRMRARCVDLAGNSLPYDTADDTKATAPSMYGRMEPVSSPMTLLRAPTTQGESVERMVIRSNYNAAATGPNERHIAPPRVAQLMAEYHGLFDTDAGLDKAAYDMIVARETNYNPDAVHPEAQLALPYLADPIARGAALRGLPGAAPNGFTLVPFDGTWPDRLPFRVVVEEGTGAPAWNAVDRVLTVKLPKAETVRVRLSSYLGADDLGIMGLWQWLTEAGLPAVQMNALRALVLGGGHWMLTPHRNLMLVHAVQQPLIEPAYQALEAEKALGDTHAIIKDDITVNGKSTDKLDIMATWDEPVDILKEPKWKTITGNAHAGELPVTYGAESAPLFMKHEFGDTKYRRVKYSAVATSRYKEYFQVPHTQTMTLNGTTAVTGDHTPIVKGSERVKSPAGDCVRDVDYKIDYAAGTIARTDGGKINSGDTVDVAYAYLPGPVTRETAAPTEVDVLNSARPAAPKVLYVVPVFSWSKEELLEGEGSVAIRRAGGLRIYMERPWFSSGDGELLGAVLWVQPKSSLIKAPPKSPPENLKPFVTQWGMDPIWLSRETYAIPTNAHFPGAVATAGGLSIEEVQGATVAVAGHKVGYDETRKLWYCDMEIDAGHSYWPFVRLALARYQPKSVTGAHLSRIVLADFAQLAPDRLATVVFDPEKPDLCAVTVCGPGYRQSVFGRDTTQIEVTVETRVPNLEGELAWGAAGSTVYPLALTEDDGGDFTWSGGVTLPTDRESKRYRLVIREYERFLADGLSQNFTTAAFVPPSVRRLVYAAVLEL
ncbi:MAG TPA: hypothetical protein VD969_24415 [Symbiobacteriaceae bacterium]|nr:hypothetical protein [Symbiobacteriaceae bacterium]